MKFIKLPALIVLSVLTISLSACKKDQNAPDNTINIFSLSDDIKMGEQVQQEIESDPQTYPILDSASNVKAYEYLHNITEAIMNSGKLNHKDDFNWHFRIIKDDNVLNAFATPGGKVYVYTGLIKYLDSEDQLAGVLGHEIAHADRRHITDEMTKIYGLQFLISMVAGNDSSMLANITQGLATLKFSRANEAEADKYSVIYLYPTEYDARGAARFFEKLIASGQQGNTPEFLSDHPNPENRVENIMKEWQSLGGKEGKTFTDRYSDFKKVLP